MRKVLLSCLLVLFAGSIAKADLLLEPYLGYEMGKGDAKSGNDLETQFTNMGARIGYSTPLMLWFALDVNLGMSGKLKPDSGSSSAAKRTTYGVVAGLDFPILLRGWVGYGFTNEINDTDNSAKYKGTNTKVGVGFTGLPFVSLNVEYIKDDFKDYEISGNTTNANLDHSSYMLSVSLPLEL